VFFIYNYVDCRGARADALSTVIERSEKNVIAPPTNFCLEGCYKMGPNFGANTDAKRKRVYYEGTDTIYEGMPLCYNHDTTDNIYGYDKGAGGLAISQSTPNTTAEGSQNEGKWLRVEAPSLDNQNFLAGVVAGTSEVGKVGPRWLDVYIPNGAIVPVRTDRSVEINDFAYLEPDEDDIPNAGTAGGPVIGIFEETIDRSSTAGLALCKLTGPELSQYKTASTLGVGLSPLLWGDAPSDAELSDPGNGINYFNDFMNEVDVTTGDGWTLTQVDTKGSITVEAAAPGGVLEVKSATGDSADDGITAQLKNCAVKPAAGVDIWFEARVKVSEADEQWAFGLAAVDTTIIAAGVWDDASDKVLFGHHTGTADKIDIVNARTTAEDDFADAADMTDDTWVTVGFKITGLTDIEYYINGAPITAAVTDDNIPNAAMCLTAVAQYEAADTILSVDWVKIKTRAGRDA